MWWLYEKRFLNSQIGVEIGVMSRSDLNDVVLTLHYFNGNCSWKFISSLGGQIVEANAGEGSQIRGNGGEVPRFYQVKCVVGQKVLLHANCIW